MLPRILCLAKIEHIAGALIQNSRFGFVATEDDIFNRPRWMPCGGGEAPLFDVSGARRSVPLSLHDVRTLDRRR